MATGVVWRPQGMLARHSIHQALLGQGPRGKVSGGEYRARGLNTGNRVIPAKHVCGYGGNGRLRLEPLRHS